MAWSATANTVEPEPASITNELESSRNAFESRHDASVSPIGEKRGATTDSKSLCANRPIPFQVVRCSKSSIDAVGAAEAADDRASSSQRYASGVATPNAKHA